MYKKKILLEKGVAAISMNTPFTSLHYRGSNTCSSECGGIDRKEREEYDKKPNRDIFCRVSPSENLILVRVRLSVRRNPPPYSRRRQSSFKGDGGGGGVRNEEKLGRGSLTRD